MSLPVSASPCLPLQPHARVAALQLLAVSAAEAPTAVFLAQLSGWVAKVAPLAAGAAEQPVRVRAAAYAALARFTTRGGSLLATGGVRREIASAVGKAVPPFLKRFQVRV